MRPIDLIASIALLAAAIPPSAAHAEALAIVSTADRPKADTDRDADRKPAELLAFAGVKAGDVLADLMPGQGYFTRIFSHTVGPSGHVYAIVPAELAQVSPKLAESAKALASEPAYPNVTVSVAPTVGLSAPVALDLAWTSDNYHDLYAFFGPDKAALFDKAVYRMLKPGGRFIVIDHAAMAGADVAAVRRLHRIDPAVVKAQVEAAGFELESESAVLGNPKDAHDLPVFDPKVRGRTDQFVLKFRKPR